MTILVIGKTNVFNPLKMLMNKLKVKISHPVRKNYSLTGFTLIELLCVIIIIALFFSLSIPRLSKTAGNFYLRSKASQIKAMCELLKRNSITENRTYKLVIDFSRNSYSVLKCIDNSNEEFSLVRDSLLKRHTLPKNLFFISKDNQLGIQEIIFKKSGSISSAVFFITNNKDKPVKISTTLSGEILIEYI